MTGVVGLPIIELLFDAAVCGAALFGGGCLVLGDAMADDFVFLGGVGRRLGFLGGAEHGGRTASGSCRTSAVVDFGFEGCGFLFDDAEAAFDRVVGGSCRVVSARRVWRR